MQTRAGEEQTGLKQANTYEKWNQLQLRPRTPFHRTQINNIEQFGNKGGGNCSAFTWNLNPKTDVKPNPNSKLTLKFEYENENKIKTKPRPKTKIKPTLTLELPSLRFNGVCELDKYTNLLILHRLICGYLDGGDEGQHRRCRGDGRDGCQRRVLRGRRSVNGGWKFKERER